MFEEFIRLDRDLFLIRNFKWISAIPLFHQVSVNFCPRTKLTCLASNALSIRDLVQEKSRVLSLEKPLTPSPNDVEKFTEATDPLYLGVQAEPRNTTLFIGLLDVLLSAFLEEETAAIPARFLERADFSVRVPIEGLETRVLVFKRPGLDKFLREASKHCELCVWTQACSAFASTLIDVIDPQRKFITKRLYREQCSFDNAHRPLKDIYRVADRKREKLFLVDDKEHNVNLHPQNSFAIKTHAGDRFFKDNELENVTTMLEQRSANQE